jgi:hypothetical protein
MLKLLKGLQWSATADFYPGDNPPRRHTLALKCYQLMIGNSWTVIDPPQTSSAKSTTCS